MNTQSEDNCLVLICIFKLRSEKKKVEKTCKWGSVCCLAARTRPRLCFLLGSPVSTALQQLTGPEIWLLNCFWPNFLCFFPRLCRSLPLLFVPHRSRRFASGVCVCNKAGGAQWLFSRLATRSGGCVALGDTTWRASRAWLGVGLRHVGRQ